MPVSRQVMHEEHGQVVALGRFPDIFRHLLLDVFQVAHGALPAMQRLHHPLFAEQLMRGVLRLREAVGVEEDGVVVAERHRLLLVLHPAHDAQREIRHDRQRPDGLGQDQRRVVAGVAIAQFTSGQVQHTAEEGHEHVALVHGGEAVVHGLDDAPGTVFMRRHVAEGRTRDRHHQRRGDALAAHVAHAEEELLVPDEEVVQVAAHLLGRDDGGGHVQVVPLREGRKGLGHHGHLDAGGDVQLALNAFPLLLHSLEFELPPDERTQHQDNHRQAHQLEEEHHGPQAAQAGIDVIFRDHRGHRPVGAFDGGAVFQGILRILALGRAYQITAVAAEHYAVCVGIHFQAADKVFEPVQRDVGRDHRRHPAPVIPDRQGISRHQHLAAAFVDIRLRPVPFS